MGASANTSNQSSSGSNSFSSTPTNLQNPAFTALAGPTSDQLQGLYKYFSQPLPSPYQTQQGQSYTGQNPLTAGLTDQQNSLVNQTGWLGNVANQNYLGMQGNVANANNLAASNPLGWANNWNVDAANNSQNILGNSQGPLNSAFSTAWNQYNPAYTNSQQAGAVANSIPTNSIPWFSSQGNAATNVTQQSNPWFGAQGASTGNLNSAFGAANNMLSPNYAANLASSPQTQAAIQSAVNPLINSFNSQTVPGLQGTFTAAGQRLGSAGSGVGGSSAFDMAGANALAGLQSNIGQVSGNIANNAYQTGLQQQSQAINQVGNLTGQQAGILGQTGQNIANANATQSGLYGQTGQNVGNAINQQVQGLLGSAGAQTNAATAQGTQFANVGNSLAQNTALQSNSLNQGAQTSAQLTTDNIQNMLSASAGSQGLLTSQLNNTINALNASALPQLTQQYGINQGLQLYQSQVGQLLQSLGLGAQAAQPAIGNIAMGQGQTSGKGSSKGGGLQL